MDKSDVAVGCGTNAANGFLIGYTDGLKVWAWVVEQMVLTGFCQFVAISWQW